MHARFSRWPLTWAAGTVIALMAPAGGAAAAPWGGTGPPRPAAPEPTAIMPLAMAGRAGIMPSGPTGITPPSAPTGITPPLAAPERAGRAGPLAAPRFTRFAGIFIPHKIITGPDGAMWFTDMQNDAIGRISTNGQARTFSDPRIALPATIAVGPDGALWFTNVYPGVRGATTGSIGRLTPAGHFTFFSGQGMQAP